MARTPKGLQTRERLMTTALREFSARGYNSVSVEEIAEMAGLTKGAFYHWFSDKDDLGRELQHQLYERLATLALGAVDPATDILTNMRRAFDVFATALGDLGESRFFLRDVWMIPALDEAGRRDQEGAVTMVRDLLSQSMERGEIRPLDVDAAARILLGAWVEATLYLLKTGKREATVDIVEHFIESLRPPRPAKGAKK